MSLSPTFSLEERLDRLEAFNAIGQLASRYAIAVDSRDIDALVALFVDDADCGKWGHGRSALKEFYSNALRAFYRTIHQICGHTIDLIDADHATGQVYCRAEHEDGKHWVIQAICYFDSYERRNGVWHFAQRKLRHWYSTDWNEIPRGPNFQRWPGTERTGGRFDPKLPHYFETWNSYWEQDPAAVERRSLTP